MSFPELPSPLQPKSIFTSKVFWFNLASFVLGQFTSVPSKWQVPVAAIGNVILRFMTKQPVTF